MHWQAILDTNRKVQIALCSALGNLMDSTGDFLIPFLKPIYQMLVSALNMNHTRALLVTLETFGSMAEKDTGEVNLPSIYIPLLIMV